MKNNQNKTVNTIKLITKAGIVYVMANTLLARLMEGKEEQYNRIDRKIFRTAVIYKLTPFGNKEKQEKKLEYLEKKQKRIYKEIMQESQQRVKTK